MDCSPEDFLDKCPSQEIPTFTMEDDTSFVEWGAVLLVQIPSLSRLRFRLVPSRLSEHNFWQRYFAAIARIVKAQVMADLSISSPSSFPTTANRTTASSPSGSPLPEMPYVMLPSAAKDVVPVFPSPPHTGSSATEQTPSPVHTTTTQQHHGGGGAQQEWREPSDVVRQFWGGLMPGVLGKRAFVIS
eukprot:GHVS01000297.1.p1 GENE.GHVS01000297.1~~GHVS01000297.1.p1  ORF type:complete len:187 (-),score=43.33 GHVS01000297.1:180-740(-)